MGELVTWLDRSHRVLHATEPRAAGKTGRLAWHRPLPVLDCSMVGRREDGRKAVTLVRVYPGSGSLGLSKLFLLSPHGRPSLPHPASTKT